MTPSTRTTKILEILLIVLFIAAAAVGYLFQNRLLTAWWIPVSLSLFIAVVSILPARDLWHRRCGRKLSAFSTLLYTIFVCGILHVLLLAANSVGLDPSKAYEREMTVIDKQQRQNTTRRHRSSIRHTHTTYQVVLADEQGKTFCFQVSRERYNRISLQHPIKIKLIDGRLGFTVIDEL